MDGKTSQRRLTSAPTYNTGHVVTGRLTNKEQREIVTAKERKPSGNNEPQLKI